MSELSYGISDNITEHPCQYIIVIGYPFSGRMVFTDRLFNTLEAAEQAYTPLPTDTTEPAERLIFRLEAVTYPNGETLRR